MQLEWAQFEIFLLALAEHLPHRVDIVVCGGASLLALGQAHRLTVDIDVLAVREGGVLVHASPLPPALLRARDTVTRDFGLPDNWLNDGPAHLLDFGLPEGFESRLVPRDFGALTVHFVDRLDQIHFKLYALVDQGPGKHERDLRALNPTREELLAAARWTRTHDPSPGYLQVLLEALDYLGVGDADVE